MTSEAYVRWFLTRLIAKVVREVEADLSEVSLQDSVVKQSSNTNSESKN